MTTIRQLEISDFDKIEDIISATAHKYWYKTDRWRRDYVFATIDDMKQVMWTTLIERNRSRTILENFEDKDGKLLATIAIRGTIDYMRSHVGRSENQRDRKYKATVFATYYMDYIVLENNDGDAIVDQPGWFPCTPSHEDEVLKNILFEEIQDFLNKKYNSRDSSMFTAMRQGMRQKEIGAQYDITESRVNQIQTKCIKAIKAKYACDS